MPKPELTTLHVGQLKVSDKCKEYYESIKGMHSHSSLMEAAFRHLMETNWKVPQQDRRVEP